MLEKYNFYSNRYLEHKKALKEAEAKRKRMLKDFEAVNGLVDNPLVIDAFLRNALDTIVEDPLGYFIQNSKEKEIFKFQQREVEKFLQTLDGRTDADFGEYTEEGAENTVVFKHAFFTFKELLRSGRVCSTISTTCQPL